MPLQFEGCMCELRRKGKCSTQRAEKSLVPRSPLTAASSVRLRNPKEFSPQEERNDGSFGKGRGESRQGQ